MQINKNNKGETGKILILKGLEHCAKEVRFSSVKQQGAIDGQLLTGNK